MQEITLSVVGMGCEGCKKTVTQALSKVEGVQSTEIDLKKGTATVTYNEPASRDDLVTSVQKAGYIVNA